MSSSRGRTAVAPFSSCSKAEWLSTTTSATTSTITTSVPPCQSIIVNADDLGYSVWTDNGIFRAFQDGLVSSASLLVNGASAAYAANRARAQDMCLGLHLNLTEGRPLSPFDSIPLLLSPDGKLLYKEAFWTAAAAACKEETSSKSKFFDQVVLETRAQLAHFHELTGTPARHVDGHQHIHIAPGVASVLAPLFKSEGILSTRIPDENIAALTWVEPTKRIRWMGRIAAAKYSRTIYAAHGVFAPDRFLGYGFSGSYMSRNQVLESLRRQLPLYDTRVGLLSRQNCYQDQSSREDDGMDPSSSSSTSSWLPISAEIMVHPGSSPVGETDMRSSLSAGCGDGIVDAFAVSADRQHECAVLCDPKLRAQISGPDHRAQLISWDDFHKIAISPENTRADLAPPSQPLMNAWRRLRVLVLAIGVPATGNHVTARRIRRALAEKCGFVVTMVNTDTATTESIRETCLRNSIDIIIGLHAYHAGQLLFPQRNMCEERYNDDDKEHDAEGKEDLSAEGHLFSSVPIVLVAGGTDLNGYGVRRMPYKKVQKSDREKMIARSLKAADAVVLFNSALLSRAKEMLDDPVVANWEANHAPFTSTTTIPTFDKKAEDTQADYSSDMPPASASKHCNCLVVIPQSVDVTGIAGQWLRHRLGIAATDMLLLLPSGIRPVKDPLFLASEYQLWNQSVVSTLSRVKCGAGEKGEDDLMEPHISLARSAWFVIIGEARDVMTLNALHEKLPDKIDGSGARGGAGRLIYLPPVSHGALLAAISEADIVLNSSRTEGQCGAILEAMALGTPVLARRNEGNCHLLGDGEDRGGLFTTAQECFHSIESGWYGDRKVKNLEGNGYHAAAPSPIVQARTTAAIEFVKERHGFEQEASSYSEILLRVATGRESS